MVQDGTAHLASPAGRSVPAKSEWAECGKVWLGGCTIVLQHGNPCAGPRATKLKECLLLMPQVPLELSCWAQL